MIADASLFIDHFRGIAGATRLLDATPEMVIPFVVAAELMTGAKLAGHPQREHERVGGLLATFPVLWPDEDSLEHFAVVRATQSRAGTPIGVHDNWIGALALQYDLPVATDDAGFKRIEGLRLVAWK